MRAYYTKSSRFIAGSLLLVVSKCKVSRFGIFKFKNITVPWPIDTELLFVKGDVKCPVSQIKQKLPAVSDC